MRKLVLASNNAGKLTELNELLGDQELEVVAQSDFDTPEAVESGLSFVENAIIKARNAAEHSRLPAIADDSGLEVDALSGAPGVRSARYAGPDANDDDNNRLLLQSLENIPDDQRTARFHCVLVFLRHPEDPTPLICHGQWEGLILHAPRGDNGFGYDPLFYIPSMNCSSAELPSETKNSLSHRGQAVRQLLEALKQAG
jgi:XTP/dITP diphosphohydrolase